MVDYTSQIQEAYSEALHITEEDSLVIKLILGAATAQHLGVRTELLWLVIIGPPASGKTTLLNPLIACQDLVVSRDDCTGNAMISASDPEGLRVKARAAGEEDIHDPSLVNLLHGKLFVIKDLTLLLNRKDEADRFWGYMRAAYDGRLEKHSGTVGSQIIEDIRFGFIAGTTDGSVEGSLIRMAKLGERAIYIRMQQDPTTISQDANVGVRMLHNRGIQHEFETELNRRVIFIFKRAIKQVRRWGPSSPGMHDPKVLLRVIHLASALSKMRTVPEKDTQIPHERNPRTVKQFGTLCDAIAICSGRRKWTMEDADLCLQVVRGSISSKMRLLFDFVCTRSFWDDPTRWPTAYTAAKAIGSFHQSNVENQLRQWANSGLLRFDSNKRFYMPKELLKHYVEIGVVLKPKRGVRSKARRRKGITLAQLEGHKVLPRKRKAEE
jgi:hypothetical protein